MDLLDYNTTKLMGNVTSDSISSKVIVTIIVGFILSLFKTVRNFFLFIWNKLIWNKLNEIFKKEAYEVLDLRKHVTVCANGHLIVLQDFRLKINKPDSAEKFHRLIDVSDGADSCRLPPLATMEKTSKSKRFNDYGFWYKSNPENIITKVKEKTPHKGIKKREEFYFQFNKKELKKLKSRVIKIMYGFSIKKGQPLNNGEFDYTCISDKDRNSTIKTGFQVQYKMNKIEYIIGLVDNFEIDEENIKMWYYPKGFDHENLKSKIKYQKKDDLFYNKFNLTIHKPEIGSIILIEIPIPKVKH